MKWALIILLDANNFSSGYWDTGLTYRSYEDCQRAVIEIRLTDTEVEVGAGSRSFAGSVLEGYQNMQCVPKK